MSSREKAETFVRLNKEFSIRQLKLVLDQHAAEQREACGQKIFEFLPKASPEQVAYAFEVKEVCLNAVEKSDE